MNIVLTQGFNYLKKYWYFVAFVLIMGVWLWKKKKSEPENVDANATDVLNTEGIKNAASQNTYKSYAAQIAEGLGTSRAWYDPRRWTEDDNKVYELVKELNTQDFNIVKKLYFTTYAKGRDLSTDLANLLDDKYYRLLKVK
jgi:hypothetical protein